MAVNVAIGLVYYVRWLAELFRPADAAGGSRYDVPNGVAVAIGMTFTAGVVFSVLPGLAARPGARRARIVRDGIAVRAPAGQQVRHGLSAWRSRC